jgi:hypothetical protein
MRTATLAPACALLLCALAGCAGETSTPSTAAALKLQREDLVAAARALKRAQTPVAREAGATKRAWPAIAGASPAQESAVSTSADAAQAVDAVASVKIPALFGEVNARSLTGPAAGIAGLFRYSALLITRGWSMFTASSKQTASRSPTASRFARENIGLYVESVYDGHFTLAQIGKKLLAAYDKLGGAAAFGTALTQAEVDALAHTYSEAGERLYPHPPVRVGS